MPELSRIVIAARLDNVRHACDAVVEAAETASLDERAVYHCQMAVDEALTNIIEHGYAYKGDAHQIEVVCAIDTAQFIITLTDDSPAFNPLNHQAPDPAEPLDTREPGGWGIYFIRRLMDDVSYQRVGDKNQLLLVKNRPVGKDGVPGVIEDAGFPVRVLDQQAAVISPIGRLDSHNSTTLQQALNTQITQGMVWIFVEMSGVEYIASSGLKVLVAAWRRAREAGGDVVLCGLQPRLIEIFEMVGFDMLFQVFPDLDTALTSRPQQS
ncbi:MAG: anti-sigma factor antagonist [Anaerolineae bacterium]|nr:anti-sigma factor antagonist [Anaerolineae bacterium]